MAWQDEMSFFEFKNKFNTEEDCRKYLFKLRWPEGFICPICGHKECYSLKTRHIHECTKCHYQVSETSGTVMEKTHLPLDKWFWAIYLVSTDKRGHSALQLSKEIQVCYKTAWYLLHRIRTAMMERDWNYKLSEIVATDEAFFGAPTHDGKRGRGTEKAKVIVSVQQSSDGCPLYAKMETAEVLDSGTINTFAANYIEKGSTIVSDGADIYLQLPDKGYQHIGNIAEDGSGQMKWVHTVISNAKALIQGTFHGLDKKYLNLYLAEFCYRFNRRFWSKQLFNRLLSACLVCAPITFTELCL